MSKSIVKIGLLAALLLGTSGVVVAITSYQYGMLQLEGDLYKLLQKAKMTGLSMAEETRVHTLLSSLAQYNQESAKNFKKQFESAKITLLEKVAMPIQEKKGREIPVSMELNQYFFKLQEMKKQYDDFYKRTYSLMNIYEGRLTEYGKGYWYYVQQFQQLLYDVDADRNAFTRDQYENLVEEINLHVSSIAYDVTKDFATMLLHYKIIVREQVAYIEDAIAKKTDNALVDFYKSDSVQKKWFNDFNHFAKNIKKSNIFNVLQNASIIDLSKINEIVTFLLGKNKISDGYSKESLAALIMAMANYIAMNSGKKSKEEEQKDKRDYDEFFNPLLQSFLICSNPFAFIVSRELINTVQSDIENAAMDALGITLKK
jgi:hypothetical protein